MKATEYYEKHRFALLNPDRGLPPFGAYSTPKEYEFRQKYRHDQHNSDISAIFIEFLKDGQELQKLRRIASPEAHNAIIRELNQKWNSLCDLFQRNDGVKALPRDYFIDEYRRLEKKIRERNSQEGANVQSNR